MVIRVERGKGGIDREIPLNQKLLETLRAHWRWLRPKTYLFPGTANGWRADKPIPPRAFGKRCRRRPSGPASPSTSPRTPFVIALRSEERRVGKECRSR